MKRFIAHAALSAAAFIDGLMLVLTLGLVIHTSAYCAVKWATWEAFNSAGWLIYRPRLSAEKPDFGRVE